MKIIIGLILVGLFVSIAMFVFNLAVILFSGLIALVIAGISKIYEYLTGGKE